MSQLQRIIVRMGNEADIPALKEAELGWDVDTHTMRVGNETHNPWKILTTGSTGVFDFSSAEVIFGKTNIGDLNGLDLESLDGSPGILVRTATSGIFTSTEIVSTDNSVNVQNGLGLNGPIDLSIDQASISNAIKPIIEDLEQLRDDVDGLINRTDELDERVAALITLSGVTAKSLHLGQFSGDIIPNNVSVKTALQSLETALENVTSAPDALAIHLNTVTALQIKLETGSVLGLPLAIAEQKAGIIDGYDKKLLDDLRGVFEAGGLSGITGYTALPTMGNIDRTTGGPVIVPLATETLSGLMSPEDKGSITGFNDRIAAIEDDIDALETRVTGAETLATNADTKASTALTTANTANVNATAAKNTADSLAVTVNNHSTTINNHGNRITSIEGQIGGAVNFYILSHPAVTLATNNHDQSIVQQNTTIQLADITWPFVGIFTCTLNSWRSVAEASRVKNFQLTGTIVIVDNVGSSIQNTLGARIVTSTGNSETQLRHRTLVTLITLPSGWRRVCLSHLGEVTDNNLDRINPPFYYKGLVGSSVTTGIFRTTGGHSSYYMAGSLQKYKYLSYADLQ